MYPKQLYYKEGRRYKEFVKIRETPNPLYYQDEDGEFVPLCEETQVWYSGKPSEGIWLVRKNSHSWIGDFKTTSERLALEKYREQITEAFEKAMEKRENIPISNHEIISCVLDSLTGIGIENLDSYDKKVVLYYVNWMANRTGNAPSTKQIEEFKKESLESIKIFVKKGYELKDAFSKVVNGYSR